MSSKASRDARASSKKTEGVTTAEAVTRCNDLGNALGLDVSDSFGEDGMDDGGVVKKCPLGGIETGGGQVERRGVALEHVWGYGKEAGACEGVGET